MRDPARRRCRTEPAKALAGPSYDPHAVRWASADEGFTMGDRVWQVAREDFARAWNAAATLGDAAERVKALVGGPAPRWAVMVRAGQLRDEGLAMKELPREKAKGAA